MSSAPEHDRLDVCGPKMGCGREPVRTGADDGEVGTGGAHPKSPGSRDANVDIAAVAVHHPPSFPWLENVRRLLRSSFDLAPGSAVSDLAELREQSGGRGLLEPQTHVDRAPPLL
jgi:hypothetical protein